MDGFISYTQPVFAGGVSLSHRLTRTRSSPSRPRRAAYVF